MANVKLATTLTYDKISELKDDVSYLSSSIDDFIDNLSDEQIEKLKEKLGI